jgi:outer membrane protein assembly factor BamB
MKFHITLVWIVILLVALAACGSTATSTAEVQANPIPTETLEPTEISEPTQVPTAAPASLSLARTIELPFIPHDIAVDAEGNLYAVELGAPMVHRLDGDGNVLASWGGAGSEAGQFAFDPPPDGPPLDGGFVVVGAEGNVYVSDSYNNRVQVFDPEGSFLTMWETYGPEGTPFNNLGPISADAEGNIYVAAMSGLHQFDADGQYVQTLSAAGEVAIDSQGNLFTVVAFENFAMKLPAGGGEPIMWGSQGLEKGQFTTPMWVVISPDDMVYIADHSGRVQQFDAEGNTMAVWSDPGNGDGPLNGPSPLAIDAEGNLYVATKGGTTVYVLRL